MLTSIGRNGYDANYTDMSNPYSPIVFSILATSTAQPFHLDLWSSHHSLSLGALHLDGTHSRQRACLQESRDTESDLPHSASRAVTLR